MQPDEPSRTLSALKSSVEARLRDAVREYPGISVSFSSPEITLERGGKGRGTVVIHNGGPDELAGSVSIGTGWLRCPGTKTIVGGYRRGWRAGTGKRLPRTPGDSVSMEFVTGTASCAPGAEDPIPAGRYELVIPLDLRIPVGGKRVLLAAEGGMAVVVLLTGDTALALIFHGADGCGWPA